MRLILVSMLAVLIITANGNDSGQQEYHIGKSGNQYTVTIDSDDYVGFKCATKKINLNELPHSFSKKTTVIPKLTTQDCALPAESLQNIAEALGAIKVTDIDLDRVPLITRNHLERAQLRNIEVSNSEVATDAFAKQSHTTSIDLKSSKFQLSEKSFSGAENLKSLSINDCKITQIPHGVFKETPKLARLNLGNNLLTKVTNLDFEGLGALGELYLGENKLTSLPNDLFKYMPNVLLFRLNKNPLKDITRDVFRGSKVAQLTITDNTVPLKISPRALAELPLIYVNLDNNNIKSLPENFLEGSSGVKELVLSNNNLEELPAGVFSNSPQLQELILTNNNLRALSQEIFAPLSKLRTLVLDDNDLTEISPATFSSLNELTSLSIAKNKLHSVARDAFPTSLNTLILDDNQLTTFETTPLPIYHLHLKNNRLSSVPSHWVDTLPELSQIYLNGNAFTQLKESDVATLAHFYNTFIFLDDNKIKTIHVGANTQIKSIFRLKNVPLRCDCHLLAFATQLHNYLDKSAVCAEPVALRGTSVTDVPLTDFTCQSEPKAQRNKEEL